MPKAQQPFSHLVSMVFRLCKRFGKILEVGGRNYRDASGVGSPSSANAPTVLGKLEHESAGEGKQKDVS